MDISKITEEFKAIRNEYDEAVKRIRENGGLKDIFNNFFAENPQVTGIVWSQYIPGFNDGDPCLFSIGDVYFSTSTEINWEEFTNPYDLEDYSGRGQVCDEILYKYDSETKKTVQSPNPNFIPAAKTIYSFINSETQLMEDLFGENSLIIVTPEKIRVEEYDCGY